MSTATKILSGGKQGPAGPPGPTGAPGSNANVTAATVLAAVQAMTNQQKADLLAALGIPTYAGLAAGNAGLNIGDVFRDSSDSNKIKTATA